MARVIERRSSRYLLTFLVLAHLALISRQVDARGGSSFLGRAVFAVVSPIERAVAGFVGGIRSAWFGYVDLRHARRENTDLRAKLAALETDMAAARNDAQEARRLRDILALQKVLPHSTTVAHITARDALPWFRIVTIDKGRAQSVALNAPVISTSGVVGRIIEVAENAAKVQVLLDQNAGVGAVTERSRVTGVVAGQMGSRDGPLDERSALDVSSRDDLLMKYVSAVSDIAVGDTVVTSGFDQIYPKGLLIGRVTYLGAPTGLFKEVRVTPSARFDGLEEVLVLEVPTVAAATFERVK
jgi:rod shape-determining protein MreC